MTPQAKVHEDGRVAIRAGRPGSWLVGAPGRTENVYHGDADVSGSGWRDAAVVLLVDGIHGVGLAPGQARFPFDIWASHTIAVGQGGQLLGPSDAREFAAALLSAAAWAERQNESC